MANDQATTMDLDLDDEGYNEEDDIPFVHSSVQALRLPKQMEQSTGICLKSGSDTDNRVNWEEVALNYTNTPDRKKLSWDDLQIPIPFRFHPNHVRLAKGPASSTPQNDGASFILDSVDKSKMCVDMLWKVGISVSPSAKITSKSDIPMPNSKLLYISSQQFIESVFHLLAARSSLVFMMDRKTGQFVKNSAILVSGISPSALWNFSLPLVELGNIVRRLSKLGDPFGNHCTSMSLMDKGLSSRCYDKTSTIVDVAFIKFTSNYIKIFQTVLMLNLNRIKTFTQLISFVRPFRHQLEVLYNIWFGSKFPHDSVVFLSHLNWLLLSECSPYSSSVIRNVFTSCAAAYLRHVSDWMFRGQLPSGPEFHITKIRNNPYRDRRFWSKQFVHANEVPEFLKESWELIFETGKAINFLQQIQHETAFPSSRITICDQEIQLAPVTSFEDLESLYSKWSCILEKFQETQADLIVEIAKMIKSILPFSQPDVDHTEVIKNAEEFAKQCYSARSTSYERKRQKQLEVREELNKQVAQTKEIRHMEALVTESENQRNLEYLAMKEKRDLDEEKRFRTKHFGNDCFPSKLDEDFYQRLHNSSLKAKSLEDPAKNGHRIDNGGEGDCKSKGVTDDTTDNNNQGIAHESDSCDASNTAGEGDGIINVHDDEHDNGSEILEIVEDEEKLDPNKLITTAPPLYDTSHITSSKLTFTTSFMSSNLSAPFNSNDQEKLSSPDKEHSPNNTKQDMHSLNLFLSQAVGIPAHIQCEMANMTLLHFFMCEKKLLYHISALNNFLCLQNGLFGHTITELLIQEVDQHHMTSPEAILSRMGRLNMILAEAIGIAVDKEDDKELSANLSFSLNRSSSETQEKHKDLGKHTSSPYESLNSIRLCYKVVWPLNVILTEEVVNYFERIFVFQMRLYRVELLLQRAFMNLKSANRKKTQQLFTLSTYRARLLHFVRTIRNYVNVTVVQCAWNEFCSSFQKMNSLDKVYESIVHHIKNINTNCLLGTKAEGVMKLLINQLVIIETFCCQLQHCLSKTSHTNEDLDSLQIPEREFRQLSQKFKAIDELGKVFIEVAYKLVNRGYYPKVSYFLELYNFNEFFTAGNMSQTKKSFHSSHSVSGLSVASKSSEL